MPPTPPNPVKVAEQKARLHWPRILFACIILIKIRFLVIEVENYLVRHNCWNIAVGSSNGNNDTKVADPRIWSEARNRKTNQGNDAVQDNHRPSKVNTVAIPSCSWHQKRSSHVRWRHQTLSSCNTKTKGISQNDRKVNWATNQQEWYILEEYPELGDSHAYEYVVVVMQLRRCQWIFSKNSCGWEAGQTTAWNRRPKSPSLWLTWKRVARRRNQLQHLLDLYSNAQPQIRIRLVSEIGRSA